MVNAKQQCQNIEHTHPALYDENRFTGSLREINSCVQGSGGQWLLGVSSYQKQLWKLTGNTDLINLLNDLNWGRLALVLIFVSASTSLFAATLKELRAGFGSHRKWRHPHRFPPAFHVTLSQSLWWRDHKLCWLVHQMLLWQTFLILKCAEIASLTYAKSEICLGTSAPFVTHLLVQEQ